MSGHIIFSPPTDHDQAFGLLRPLLDKSLRNLTDVSEEEFGQAWASIAFLYPGLHPDGSTSRGLISTEIEQVVAGHPCEKITKLEPRLLAPYYVESGWPVVLVPIAEEAARRYAEGRMADTEYYNVEAQRAGLS